VAIAGERGAVWLGLVERTLQACIFLKWLDEGTDGSYHLTDDPPTSVSYNSLMCADVGLDLANCMRPALHRDWPNLEDCNNHVSPPHSEEPDPVQKSRGSQRRGKDVGTV